MSRSRIHREQTRERRKAVRALCAPRLTGLLRTVWEEACWVISHIFWIEITPTQLATRGYITRADHRRYADLIRHCEILVSQFVLAAACTLQLVLRPLIARATRGLRKRRRYILWPDAPQRCRAGGGQALAVVLPRSGGSGEV